jgi:hypothetical protein
MGTGTVASGDMVHGAQSVGVTTNFNLEQAFELGQLEIYENIEGLPDVEVTLEKVLDGYPLIYHLATTGAVDPNSLVSRSKAQCDLRLGIYSEDKDFIADQGAAAPIEMYCSGMYVSSVSYTLPTDGNATESVTLVGNNKEWLLDGTGKIGGEDVVAFSGNNSPIALLGGSGGIQRREDIMIDKCVLPLSIQGVSNVAGTGNGWDNVLQTPRVHVQSVTISTDFSREDINELGRKTPYYRPAGFPVEVTCEIEAISASGDLVTALENGDPQYIGGVSAGNNTAEEYIYFETRCGYGWDLGSKNRLSSVSYGGGDAGGGNVSCTYSYSNFNRLEVQHSGTNFEFTRLGPVGLS